MVLDHNKNAEHSVADLTDQILYGVADDVCLEKFEESTGVY